MSIRRRRLIRIGAFGTSPTAQLQQTLFSEGQQGVLYYPKPMVDGEQVLWQQSDGTIVVDTHNDPVGRMDDLSGNANHATQVTSGEKVLYRTDGTLHWVSFDGVNDNLLFDMGAMPASETSSINLSVKFVPGGNFALISSRASSGFFLLAQDGSNSMAISGMGASAVWRVDGNIPATQTRNELYDLLADGQPHVVTVINADLSNVAWQSCVMGIYEFASGFEFEGDYYSLIISESGSDDAMNYVADRAGVTL